MATDRIISPQVSASPEDERINWSLRPQHIDEYVGQPELIER
ncbi:MAG: Holliday junction branch migration DNA helicase RuvB, partial [Planctomycetota bacterium]